MKNLSFLAMVIVASIISLFLFACSGQGFSGPKITDEDVKEMVKEVAGNVASPYVLRTLSVDTTYKKLESRERVNPSNGIKESVVPIEIVSSGYMTMSFPSMPGTETPYKLNMSFTALCYNDVSGNLKCSLDSFKKKDYQKITKKQKTSESISEI